MQRSAVPPTWQNSEAGLEQIFAKIELPSPRLLLARSPKGDLPAVYPLAGSIGGRTRPLEDVFFWRVSFMSNTQLASGSANGSAECSQQQQQQLFHPRLKTPYLILVGKLLKFLPFNCTYNTELE